MGTVQPKEIIIADQEDNIGDAKELAPKDKARLTLAAWILAALMVLTIFSAILLVTVPNGREGDAREFFSFVKAMVPPLVTLVIGFYFNSQGD